MSTGWTGGGSGERFLNKNKLLMKTKTLPQIGWLLIVLAGLVINGNSQSFLTNGLVAYYPFNGNANDESGNGSDGTVNGAVLIADRLGHADAAYHFSSTDLSRIVASARSLPTGSTARTFSLWIKPDPKYPRDHFVTSTMFSYGDDKSVFHLYLNYETNPNTLTVNLNVRTPSGFARWGSWTYGWEFSLWHAVVFTISSDGDVKIYINGSAFLVTPPPANPGFDIQPETLSVGNVQSNCFDGGIDDVRVYSRELSPSEVRQLFDFERPKLTDGLVALYPFNGNADDETPNANNGTPINAVLTTDRFGQAAKAYEFNGATAYVSAPNRSYLTFPNGGDFTMSVWAAFENLPTQWPDSFTALMAMDNGPGAKPKWIFPYGELAMPNPPGYGGRHYVHFNTSGSTAHEGYWLACKEYGPNLGIWHNYLVTKAGTTYTLYIDGIPATGTTNYYVSGSGVQQSDVTGPSSIISGITAPLTIGWAEGSGTYFSGKLDDIRIYNRALSGAEVHQLYVIESGPRVDLIKAVKPTFSNLTIGTKYQLLTSPDMKEWTNVGSPFTATATTMVYPQYWDVDNWNSLHFQLKVVP